MIDMHKPSNLPPKPYGSPSEVSKAVRLSGRAWSFNISRNRDKDPLNICTAYINILCVYQCVSYIFIIYIYVHTYIHIHMIHVYIGYDILLCSCRCIYTQYRYLTLSNHCFWSWTCGCSCRTLLSDARAVLQDVQCLRDEAAIHCVLDEVTGRMGIRFKELTIKSGV
jgi:hypothetical protein